MIYAELPNVKTIGDNGINYLFMSDKSLVSVKIPALEKASGTGMFHTCTSLRELYMSSTNDDITLGNTPYSKCDLTKFKLYVPEEHIEF